MVVARNYPGSFPSIIVELRFVDKPANPQNDLRTTQRDAV